MLCSVQLDVKLVIATANYFFYLDGNVHFFNAACMIFFSFISCCIKETLIWRKKKSIKGLPVKPVFTPLIVSLSSCVSHSSPMPHVLVSLFLLSEVKLESESQSQPVEIYIYFLILHEHRTIWKQVLYAIITRRELYVLCRSKVHSCVYVSLCR